jgi:uncharacterized membrane protein
MSSLSDAKVLGGIGSLLALLVVVPMVGWLIGIAGLVMVFIAIRKISQAVGERKIYKEMQVAAIIAIGAIAVAAITAAGAFLAVFGGFHFPALYSAPFTSQGFAWGINSTHPAFNSVSRPFGVAIAPFSGLGIAIIAGLLTVWGMLVAAAIFVRRSYSGTAQKLKSSMFDTAGLVLLIGVATAIIGVGLVLIVIAEILLAIAFFSIRETQVVPAEG